MGDVITYSKTDPSEVREGKIIPEKVA